MGSSSREKNLPFLQKPSIENGGKCELARESPNSLAIFRRPKRKTEGSELDDDRGQSNKFLLRWSGTRIDEDRAGEKETTKSLSCCWLAKKQDSRVTRQKRLSAFSAG